jgi:drug/metabolite transporter (DMT)-like permease
MTALGRCGFALPVLGVLSWLEHRHGAAPIPVRSRWLARAAGVFLAGDLILWSHAIADIGAGLGTVVTNFQVVLVALLAWAILGERPHRSLLVALPVMLVGLVLVGGLAGKSGYGTHPAAGALFGLGVAVLYAAYIFMLRQATAVVSKDTRRASVAAPLLEATIGATLGSVILGLSLRDFRLGPAWPSLGWLVLLALTSQVLGWLLITMAMPGLPAWLVSALLLVQPAGSLTLSAVFLGERPSALQVVGVVVILAGVLIAAYKPRLRVTGKPEASGSRRRESAPPRFRRRGRPLSTERCPRVASHEGGEAFPVASTGSWGDLRRERGSWPDHVAVLRFDHGPRPLECRQGEGRVQLVELSGGPGQVPGVCGQLCQVHVHQGGARVLLAPRHRVPHRQAGIIAPCLCRLFCGAAQLTGRVGELHVRGLVSGRGCLPAAESGRPVACFDEVVNQPGHVVPGARRRVAELVSTYP